MRLIWRTRALRDLSRQMARIAEQQPLAAVRMYERIQQSANVLRDHPEMGRAGRAALTREWYVPGTPYFLVYRVGREIHILRVIHTARNWP